MAKKDDGKVLLVTDYFGILHKTPVGNKAYYDAQNAKNKNLQFGVKETTEEEADKYIKDNNGKDPKFINPSEAVNVISGKDDEIAKLKAKIAELEKGSASATTTGKVAATDLIEKINAAKTVEEVEGLVTNDETRVTVIDAAKAKKKELKDAAK